MRGVACITSDRSVSLQRVCKDIIKVFNMHGISDTKMILAADADPRHYRDVSFAITVMTYDPVWAVPYFYLARSLKIKGKLSLFYTTIEGKAKRTQFDYWVLRDLSFIANSNYTAERLREVGARIDAVVYHGVDIEEIQRYSYRRNFVRRWLGLKEDDFVVGYIAGCYPRKGHHIFPEAIKIVRERDPSIKFVVVTKEKCVDFYSGLDNVVVVPEFGQLTDDTILSMYHAFDLYTQASLSEGFGLPVVEALAAGKPVVHVDYNPLSEITDEKTSFRVPVMARDFKDEGGGILYELHYYDPNDLAQAILYAKDEVVKNREEYAARCLERAKIFDIRRVYKFFVDIYAKGEINEFSTREHADRSTDIRVSFSA